MRVLVWPDTHCPWEHPSALEFLCKIREKYKCDRVINLGDEIDSAAMSVKWPFNPDMPSASHELELAIESLERFYKEFPVVDIVESNHGMRIFKKARVSGLPSMVIRRYEEILKYPKNWTYHTDGIEIEKVYYFHGEGLNGGSWMRSHQRFKQSVVHGHLHSNAGVIYSQNRKNKFFVMNAGCLIDPFHKAFDYGKHFIEKPVIGCGVVIDGEEALFIPMPEKLRRHR